MYNKELLRGLKSRATLRVVVSSYLPLEKEYRRNKKAKRKKVSGYLAKCPFHYDKTPSFRLYRLKLDQPGQNPHRGTWGCKCFGCGISGDVFWFVMAMENVDFPEAFKIVDELRGRRSTVFDKNQYQLEFPDLPPLVRPPKRQRMLMKPKGIHRLKDFRTTLSRESWERHLLLVKEYDERIRIKLGIKNDDLPF